MPQFDPQWFASQIFWLTVVFTVLYFVLSRFAIPRIGDVLEERQAKIEDDLRKAEELKAEAEKVLNEYEAALAQARGEAQAELKKTQEALQAESSKRHAEFGAELAKSTKAAEERIAKAKESALGEIQGVAAETAVAATKRLIGASVDKAEADKAVAAVKG
jgi:F-type H+-transporting ATPase subunit b